MPWQTLLAFGFLCGPPLLLLSLGCKDLVSSALHSKPGFGATGRWEWVLTLLVLVAVTALGGGLQGRQWQPVPPSALGPLLRGSVKRTPKVFLSVLAEKSRVDLTSPDGFKQKRVCSLPHPHL